MITRLRWPNKKQKVRLAIYNFNKLKMVCFQTKLKTFIAQGFSLAFTFILSVSLFPSPFCLPFTWIPAHLIYVLLLPLSPRSWWANSFLPENMSLHFKFKCVFFCDLKLIWCRRHRCRFCPSFCQSRIKRVIKRRSPSLPCADGNGKLKSVIICKRKHQVCHYQRPYEWRKRKVKETSKFEIWHIKSH